MSIYIQKARELGELILSSEYAKDLADAQAAFGADFESVRAMEKYKILEQKIRNDTKRGKLSREESEEAKERLDRTGAELKAQPIIGALVNAENEYNTFVNGIMNVLKTTVMGKECDSTGCAKCGGCGG